MEPSGRRRWEQQRNSKELKASVEAGRSGAGSGVTAWPAWSGSHAQGRSRDPLRKTQAGSGWRSPSRRPLCAARGLFGRKVTFATGPLRTFDHWGCARGRHVALLTGVTQAGPGTPLSAASH